MANRPDLLWSKREVAEYGLLARAALVYLPSTQYASVVTTFLKNSEILDLVAGETYGFTVRILLFSIHPIESKPLFQGENETMQIIKYFFSLTI